MRDFVRRSDGSTGRTGQRLWFALGGQRTVLIILVALSVFSIAGPRVWQARAASSKEGSRESFSFAASGDHARNDTTIASLKALRTSGTDFHLALGDLSYGGSESSWCDLVKSHVGNGFPFQLVAGNHEEKQMDKFTACLPDHMDSTGTYGQQYYFDYPKKDPLARFILVSPDISFPGLKAAAYTPQSERYNWVSASIDDARSHRIRWVVVGMHKVCITAGVKKCEIGEALLNLLIEKKVDLIVQAHDHDYQRSKQLALGEGCDAIKAKSYNARCIVDDKADGAYAKGTGSVIVIDGTFGQTLYDVSSKDAEAKYFAKMMGKNATPTHGFVRYELTKNRISAKFMATDGGKFTDSFTINSEGEGEGEPSPSPSPSSPPIEGEAARGIRYVGVSTASTGRSPASSLALPKPSRAGGGTLLLAVIGADYGHVGTPPKGWTLIKQQVKKGDDLAIQSYYKVAGADEPDTYDWPIVSGGKPAAKGLGVGGILVFRGVDSANPIFDSAIRAQTPDRTRLECPSLEAPSGGILVCGYMVDDPDTVTMPEGVKGVGTMTVRGDDTFAVGYESRPVAGSTGIRAAGMNNVGGGSDDFSHAIMLRPTSSR